MIEFKFEFFPLFLIFEIHGFYRRWTSLTYEKFTRSTTKCSIFEKLQETTFLIFQYVFENSVNKTAYPSYFNRFEVFSRDRNAGTSQRVKCLKNSEFKTETAKEKWQNFSFRSFVFCCQSRVQLGKETKLRLLNVGAWVSVFSTILENRSISLAKYKTGCYPETGVPKFFHGPFLFHSYFFLFSSCFSTRFSKYPVPVLK